MTLTLNTASGATLTTVSNASNQKIFANVAPDSAPQPQGLSTKIMKILERLKSQRGKAGNISQKDLAPFVSTADLASAINATNLSKGKTASFSAASQADCIGAKISARAPSGISVNFLDNSITMSEKLSVSDSNSIERNGAVRNSMTLPRKMIKFRPKTQIGTSKAHFNPVKLNENNRASNDGELVKSFKSKGEAGEFRAREQVNVVQARITSGMMHEDVGAVHNREPQARITSGMMHEDVGAVHNREPINILKQGCHNEEEGEILESASKAIHRRPVPEILVSKAKISNNHAQRIITHSQAYEDGYPTNPQLSNNPDRGQKMPEKDRKKGTQKNIQFTGRESVHSRQKIGKYTKPKHHTYPIPKTYFPQGSKRVCDKSNLKENSQRSWPCGCKHTCGSKKTTISDPIRSPKNLDISFNHGHKLPFNTQLYSYTPPNGAASTSIHPSRAANMVSSASSQRYNNSCQAGRFFDETQPTNNNMYNDPSKFQNQSQPIQGFLNNTQHFGSIPYNGSVQPYIHSSRAHMVPTLPSQYSNNMNQIGHSGSNFSTTDPTIHSVNANSTHMFFEDVVQEGYAQPYASDPCNTFPLENSASFEALGRHDPVTTSLLPLSAFFDGSSIFDTDISNFNLTASTPRLDSVPDDSSNWTIGGLPSSNLNMNWLNNLDVPSEPKVQRMELPKFKKSRVDFNVKRNIPKVCAVTAARRANGLIVAEPLPINTQSYSQRRAKRIELLSKARNETRACHENEAIVSVRDKNLMESFVFHPPTPESSPPQTLNESQKRISMDLITNAANHKKSKSITKARVLRVESPDLNSSNEELNPNPAGTTLNEEVYYIVESIVSERHTNNMSKLEYLVKWEGWPEASNTWEKASELKLTAMEAIRDFRNRKFE